MTIPSTVAEAVQAERQSILEAMAARQSEWLDQEMEKLDCWAEDKRAGLKADLKDLDDQI